MLLGRLPVNFLTDESNSAGARSAVRTQDHIPDPEQRVRCPAQPGEHPRDVRPFVARSVAATNGASLYRSWRGHAAGVPVERWMNVCDPANSSSRVTCFPLRLDAGRHAYVGGG